MTRTGADRARLGAGLALLVLAALCFCIRLAAPGTDRSWDADPTAPDSYRLVLGGQYRLSTPEGPAEGPGQSPLSCSIAPLDAPEAPAQPLTVRPLSGERVTHDLASFVSPVTGSARIACAGLTVFVDDAEGLGRDLGSTLLAAGAALGALGLLLASSAARPVRRETLPTCGPVADGGGAGTTVEAAPGM